MAGDISFTDEEMAIDEGLGYPRAYARLCRDKGLSPYNRGPPFTFTPYILQPHEALRADELDQLFPIIDPKAKSTTKPKLFVSLLWKQLNHLGNAGFDPAIVRVDHYGNVLYYHADSASPLAWDIDHWFPCSRGGLTVPSNLRLLQRKVCKKKHNKLEFLVPWWDLQLGISINQFLSIFASSNSDFRCRSFSLLFSEGENEELNGSTTVESHRFPQHFKESKEQVGLAPAAIVLSRRESHDDASSALKALDFNRHLRPNSSVIASRKLKPGASKENEIPDMVTNPYQAIVMARDSLKQREETAKMHLEVQKLDEEVNDLKRKNEEEKMAIQDLELVLIKRKRRAEKCRRLAESQSSYRIMLEKMIRDAMHQSVIYKEQVRLNQAASNALMARLEAQKAICDASEKDLHRKFKQRDEIEKQIRPEWEQARKRSRMDDTLGEERNNNSLLPLPGTRPRTPRSRMDDDLPEGRNDKTFLSLEEAKPRTPRLSMDRTFIEERYKKAVLSLEQNKPITPVHKELRVFFEEEKKGSEAALSLKEECQQEEIEEGKKEPEKYIAGEKGECSNSLVAVEDQNLTEDKLQTLEIEDGGYKYSIPFPVRRGPEAEEDEEIRRQRGKGNVEKWLQMLLENTPEDLEPQNVKEHCDIIRKINVKSPQKEEIKNAQFRDPYVQENVRKEKDSGKRKEWIQETEAGKAVSRKSNASEMITEGKKVGSSPCFEGKGRREKGGKEREGIVRSESARAFRPIPSSPLVILGMRKGVDCIMKKPLVIGDDEGDEDRPVENNFVKSSIKTIKKAVVRI